jgi:prepilin signal peptidase PulO-like enzyme (type II secretory pathway)
MPLKRGEAREGYVIEHPNREKAASKATKYTVVLLLLVSAALMVIVTVGGWEALVGAKALQIAYILLYLGMAFLVLRWNRGILPVSAALAIILLIFSAVSAPEWFDRDKEGFTDPTLDENILGLLTFILVPVQVLLIGFSMRGFQQAWNVEVERPADGRSGGNAGGGRRAEPQPA